MPKTKISITVDDQLLKQADEHARNATRSQVFELALRNYLRRCRRVHLEAQIEAYYRELPESELEEDTAWSELGAKSAGDTWS